MATTMASSARRIGRHLSSIVTQSERHTSLLSQSRCLVTVDLSNSVANLADNGPRRCFATKKKKKNANKEEEGESMSYLERKTAAKQMRMEAYKHKLERASRVKSRRDNAPKDVKKDEFLSWWAGRRAYEEQMDRKARQAGMDWTIQVATVVERLPIVMPDKEDFETEFEDLQAYIQAHRGKAYPKEFLGPDSGNRPEAYTEEELMAMLPENFKPAPRETKADEDGTVITVDRRLKDRVYLMVGDSFPTTELKLSTIEDEEYGDECETLLDAALRGLKEKTSGGSGKKKGELPLDLYCASKSPLGVRLDVYDEDKQKSTGCYGTKTFFMKVQYDDGALKGDDIAWLDRSEIVDRFQAASKDDEAKFYRYLL
mmetsp:Transcript_921/g.2341  ORF Transcript_921/g.2341 Transcript_921/m.2341 type:complete len:371 (+) Transcript_921:134-1246(+)|eukprot:CAMPEP_0172376628 /NCGR_PEP_ID=MMETSP1060-20121228/68060_1 /TAXON_ID=37318 /ORGANISM="Pseudo-nitzschia pungens, Strain cf. cingulata" /LENGTH=370 /DNA_ID=CAMNT_0013104249 /DNA_START=56 /DNA_END=1168 /DNA_ORIENTATION=+